MPANRSVSSATFPVHLAAGGHPPLVTCSEIIRPTMTQGLAQHIHLSPFDLTAEVLDLDEFKRCLGSAPAVEFNAEGGLRWAATWDQLEARWNAVLGLETTIDTFRTRLNGISGEMEVSLRRVLTTEEKPQASAADLSQWTTAKSRVNLILPKARHFIQRAAWTKGTSERQRLDAFFKNADGLSTPVREMDQVLEELELLLENLKLSDSAGLVGIQRMQIGLGRCSGSLEENAARKVAATRSPLERGIGPGSNHRDSAHQIESALGRDGSLAEEAVAGTRKTACLGGRRVAMDQSQDPRLLHSTEGERLYSSRHLATGTLERKRLGEFFKHADGFSIPCTERDEMLEELEVLRQNLQNLSTRGWAVSNECKSVSADVQQALSKLQSSSAARGGAEKGRNPCKVQVRLAHETPSTSWRCRIVRERSRQNGC